MRRLFFMLMLCLLIIGGCNLSGSFFDDYAKNQDRLDPVVYHILGSETIGSEGGTIDLEEFVIEFPANALDNQTEIVIYKGEGPNEFLDYGNSGLYQVHGLPARIYPPIHIKVKCDEKQKGDPLMAVGNLMYSTSLDSIVYAYSAREALYEDGIMTYTYVGEEALVGSPLLKNQNTADPINFIALNAVTSTVSEKDHFRVIHPILLGEEGSFIGQCFEEAYEKGIDMGFEYMGRVWPADVITIALASGGPGSYTFFVANAAATTDQDLRDKFNFGKFTINVNYLKDKPLMRYVCGHEFLHLVQNLYEFSSPFVMPEQGWMKEATAVWFQGEFSDEEYYLPVQHLTSLDYPLRGLNSSSATMPHAHLGYGLSPFIKDIEQIEGKQAIVKIFENIKAGILPAGAVNPVDAILSVLKRPLKEYHYGVLKSYILGDYYNSQVNFKFLDNDAFYKNTFTLDMKNKYHSEIFTYWDLSGEVYKIIPGDINSFNNESVTFTISDPTNCGLAVYLYKKGKEIALMGESIPGGSGEVVLGNVKSYFKNGYQLVVLVSNSSGDKDSGYQSGATIELKVELDKQDREVVYADVWIYLDKAESKVTDSDGTSGSSFGLSFYHKLNNGTNSYSNNEFRTIWDNSPYGSNVTINGIMDITILKDPYRIDIEIDVNKSAELPYPFSEDYKIKLEGIPYWGPYPYGEYMTDWDNFKSYVEYQELGSALSRAQFDYYSTYRIGDFSSYEESINTNCGDDAQVLVKVYYK